LYHIVQQGDVSQFRDLEGGNFFALSNMYEFGGDETIAGYQTDSGFKSVEAAFHFAKYNALQLNDVLTYFGVNSTDIGPKGSLAFMRNRISPGFLPGVWDEMSGDVMKDLVRKKFELTEMQYHKKEVADKIGQGARIIEGSPDNVDWGCILVQINGKTLAFGKNRLGQIITDVCRRK
jgi:predicted NAD-dependent protein-ADP-ribosyltransferase YbiA (DUF1768 family)